MSYAKPGGGDYEKPGSEKPNWDTEIEKVLASECPTIEADPNEASTGPICDDYLCGRDCNEGFKPNHPMKVFSKLLVVIDE